jgi:hypothetical protein
VIGSDKPALVDDEDFEWASKFEWFLDENGYVVRWRMPGEVGMADDDEWIDLASEVVCRHTPGLSLSKFRRVRSQEIIERNRRAKERREKGSAA